MDLEGFEPSTSSVRLKRAPNCATGPQPGKLYLMGEAYVKAKGAAGTNHALLTTAMSFFHILSLDGGGIRGLFTAILLERLEAARPGLLAQVDLFAGASTGGILALGLAAGRTPSQARELYELRGRQVFANARWDNWRDLGHAVRAQYSNAYLKKVLTQEFGDMKLGDLPHHVLIAAFDLENDPANPPPMRTWKPKFFHNFPGHDTDAHEKVVDVALRTSAAPSYFPIYQGYIDGGVVAGNPSMTALAQNKFMA